VETRHAPVQAESRRSGSDSPPSSSPTGSIPDYLEPFIVDQDSARYSAIDQAVWRFVLLQLHARLACTAHPSYVRGLAQSGISPEHIPSIGEMNRRLATIGWRAVCVDGFIPPRAFTAFQALGVLPIAAEIRTPDHLPYTPAPDIIHEAAGHAPILIDPRYAAYIRASGEIASRAFASPADARVDRAVRLLSELKDSRDSLPPDVRSAEAELSESLAALGPASEAARMARLYWWTAEYGLVGTTSDYRLYGAGLLSSLAESHFCHGAEVRKLPLSAACADMGYDITRPQPQLFVARDFEHLHEVLDELSGTLAFRRGGVHAVRCALQSRELCTVQLEGGVELVGVLAELGGTDPDPNASSLWLRFEPGAALVESGRLVTRLESDYWVPVGPLADGTDPRLCLPARAAPTGPAGSLHLRYASGIELCGTLLEPASAGAGCLWLCDVRIERPGQPPVRHPGRYPVPLSSRVLTARAGSSCAEVSPLGPLQHSAHRSARPRVPKERAPSVRYSELDRSYAAAASLRSLAPSQRAERIAALHTELETRLPHEWLLRWNLLECLTDLGQADGALGRHLRARLLELERYHQGQHPIALGLDFLEQQSLEQQSLEQQSLERQSLERQRLQQPKPTP
jgi:phenylalanine-4-hydroxylase